MLFYKKVNIFSWVIYYLIKEIFKWFEIVKNLYILWCMEGNVLIIWDWNKIN